MLILILCVCSHTADLKRQEMARPGEPRPPAADRETIAIYVYYLAEQTTTGSAACWVRLSVSDPNDGGCPIRAVQAGGEPRGTGGGGATPLLGTPWSGRRGGRPEGEGQLTVRGVPLSSRASACAEARRTPTADECNERPPRFNSHEPFLLQ